MRDPVGMFEAKPKTHLCFPLRQYDVILKIVRS